MTSKEDEYDWVQDGYWLGQFEKIRHERDELRAEVERLKQGAKDMAVQLHDQYLELADTLAAVRQDYERSIQQRDELRAEVERLRAVAGGLVRDNSQLTQMLADLRAALTEITDLELEGDASVADAMRIADEALNPPA
jgi:chromosome segregation ATPase